MIISNIYKDLKESKQFLLLPDILPTSFQNLALTGKPHGGRFCLHGMQMVTGMTPWAEDRRVKSTL